LADIVLLFHFAIVLFAIFGGLIVLYKRWLVWLHIPVLLWSSVVNLASWICPLTPLEHVLRSLAGQAGYQGGFVEHYIVPLVYPNGMSRDIEIIAGFSILVWNGLVYTFVICWRRRHRSTPDTALH
jgi:Protein of Unknown function (DUF2784)